MSAASTFPDGPDSATVDTPPTPALGSLRKPTVVLLHCSGSSSRQWQALTQALQPRFHVHAIDLHGHGDQPGWAGTTTMTLADDAALAEPFMAQGDVHLVGHSYGAVVATKLALLHPNRVRSLVAYEPVLMSWLIDDDARSQATQELLAASALVRSGLLRGRADEAAGQFIDYWSGAGHWGGLPAPRREAVVSRMPAVGRHFDALVADRLDLHPLRVRRLPSLWLCGTATVASMQRVAHLLRKALPAASHESLEGAGHMAPLTHASVFNSRVLEFLHERREIVETGRRRAVSRTATRTALSAVW